MRTGARSGRMRAGMIRFEPARREGMGPAVRPGLGPTLREEHAKDGAPTVWLCLRKAGPLALNADD
jgi:hypothetical protein